MAQRICVLLLVVVASGQKVNNSYPVQNLVVINLRGVVDLGFHHHPARLGSFLKKYHVFKRKHGRFSHNGIGPAHGGHYGSNKYHSHRHDHGHSHGHDNSKSHGHGHGGSDYSNYKKYDRFSYGGKAYKLTCRRKRFFKLWKDCFTTHHHSRSYCFEFLRKKHLFVTYGAE
ncbi:cation diffusion facilitator family protein 1-like [Mytilus edulis]|uniref:cation diffusion facilitator family protein 1-like n=1 Tax=Mytilus edulis TaxID=6550 RepID=UPI0039EE2FF9